MADPTPTPTPAPKAKRTRHDINQAWLDELTNSEQIVAAAQKPAYATALATGGIDATKVTALSAAITAARSNLTFNAGTAVAWFMTNNYSWGFGGGHGLHPGAASTCAFNGTAGSPCYFVKSTLVQEAGDGNWAGNGGIVSQVTNSASAPLIRANFTHFIRLSGEYDEIMREADGSAFTKVWLRDCTVWNAEIGRYACSLRFTNCFFGRGGALSDGDASGVQEFIMRNCTMVGHYLLLNREGGGCWPWSIRNCAFDRTAFYLNWDDGCTNNDDFTNNAYVFGDYDEDNTRLHPTNSPDTDIILTNFNWQAGPLGDFYLPHGNTNDGSLLIDAGDTNADVYGLSMFTTQTNLNSAEGSSTVDIGYHYMGLDGNGHLLDPDGDGVQNGEASISSIADDGSENDATEPTNSSGDDGQNGEFEIKFSNLIIGQPSAAVMVNFTMSGSATFNSDYVLSNDNTGLLLTNSVVISNGNTSVAIDVVPLYDTLVEFDESVIMTLLPGTNYYVSPSQPSASILIHDNLPDNVFTSVSVSTNRGSAFVSVPKPVGIDYDPANNSVIVSVNNSTGQPFNFMRLGLNDCGSLISEQWSDVTNVADDEVYFSIVKSNAAGFTQGDMCFGHGTAVDRLSADGLHWTNNWGLLTDGTTSNTGGLRGALYFDRTGVFSNQLVAVEGHGPGDSLGPKTVWLVNSNGQARLLASINTTHLEGVTTLTNDTTIWGPWAGKIITGDESPHPNPLIYTIAIDGVVGTNDTTALFPDGIHPEDFSIIPTNQDLYACDSDANTVIKFSRTLLTNYVGDLVVMDAGEYNPPAKLFIVHWNGTNFVIRKIDCKRADGSDGHLEHITFAPIDIPSH